MTGAGDILDDLQMLFPRRSPDRLKERAAGPLFRGEAAVLACVDSSKRTLDEIAERSGLPLPKVSSLLLGLEMKRLVKQLPGQLLLRASKVTACR